MQVVLTDQARLVMLIALCGILWALESIIPLYKFRNSRVRHAMPNVALTLMFVLTNLSLSFSSAYLADFSVSNGIGLFPLLGLSSWGQVIFGVLALDSLPISRTLCCTNHGLVGSSIAFIILRTQLMSQPLFVNTRAKPFGEYSGS